MKGDRRVEPNRELLDEVIYLADARANMPLYDRGQLNVWGVYCRVNQLPGGGLLYQAGGRFVARLRFVHEVNGSTLVRKYKPGDWEKNLARLYDFFARFKPEGLERGKEMETLLAGAKDTEEKIQRLEQRASEVPNQTHYWSTASMLVGWYREVAMFKEAETEAIAAVEAWPNVFIPHLELGLLYFITVLNAKRSRIGEANEVFIRKYGPRATELTPESLGYSYEQVRTLAERSLLEAVEAAPPVLAVKGREYLSSLGQIDKAPSHEDFEKAVRRSPNSAAAWSALAWKHMEAGRFREAEKAASTAVSLAPDVAQLHFSLSTIFLAALANAKEARTSLAVSKQPLNDLTLELLGCDYERAREMVKAHATETVRLSKNKSLRIAAEDQLANLRLLDQM
jgi:tetratricopeptide (TPR) repeat protein